MAERVRTLRQLGIGIPFLILYVAALFPAVLAVSIVFGVVDAAWRLVFGHGTRLTAWSSRLWDWNGSNARYALTGAGDFELLP